MKQRISVEQLQELTEEQKERLREWWKPVEGDFLVMSSKEYCLYDKGCVGDRLIFTDVDWVREERAEGSKGDCLPLLSIGQCLELLKGKLNDIVAYSPGYLVTCIGKDGIYSEELIDALWEAVKEVVL